MKTCVLCFLLILQVFGGGEGWVPSICKSITLETEEAGYSFTIEGDSKRSLKKVSGTWGSASFEVPEDELKGISGVVLSDSGIKVNSSVSGGKQKSVFLVLIYSYSEQLDPKKGTRILVPNVVKFHFTEGKYQYWEKAESKGDVTGGWNLITKARGEQEKSRGSTTGTYNPFIAEDDDMGWRVNQNQPY
jgi:hypothetical protein